MRATDVGPFGGGRLSRTAADKSPCSAKVEAVISDVVHGVIPSINNVWGLKKQNPRSGSRPGVRILWQATPKVVGAVWVSGAPVAKPIPKIKSCSVRAHRFGHACFAGGLTNGCGCVMQHVLSPMSGGSLLESGSRVQSKIAMDVGGQGY